MSVGITRQRFELTEAEFERIRRLVHVQTGIALSSGKRELVYGRLAKRLRELELGSFAEYCDLLTDEDAGELQELTNAITTNLTSFFRESHHFEQLGRDILPRLAVANRPSKRLRVWSAGCSTGEEAVSIAIVLRETLAGLRDWDIKVLATDIDSKVVATAAAGIYAGERFRGMPADRLQRWFTDTPEGRGQRKTADEVKALITYKQLNLLEPWPMSGPFDVIFCRNVVIYFDKATQHQLFERMAQLQRPGTWLIIGHSENLLDVTERYRLIARTVYQRVD